MTESYVKAIREIENLYRDIEDLRVVTEADPREIKDHLSRAYDFQGPIDLEVMVEDIARNLEPAAKLGMTTLWVRTGTRWGNAEHDADYVHHKTDDLAAWLGKV